ncbi:MAG TPA: hypothetical protein DEA05_06860 [Rhodobacteraceae bacterium]|nr:hypothetical protein [Paracoccaceae bacterium]
MPTKAELEAELAALKAELAAAGESTTEKMRARAEDTAEGLRDMLKETGLDRETLDSLGPQIIEALAKLQKDHPLAVTAGAFALGVMVGRASK